MQTNDTYSPQNLEFERIGEKFSITYKSDEY